jgi:hypothetical protein
VRPRLEVLESRTLLNFPQPGQFPVGIAPYALALADVNGDGKADVVAADKAANSVSVLLSKGDGTFQQQRTFAAGPGPVAVAVADLNGDGRPDIVTADRANILSNEVSVLLGSGDGSFQAARSFAVGRYPTAVAVADVNGDGPSAGTPPRWRWRTSTATAAPTSSPPPAAA